MKALALLIVLGMAFVAFGGHEHWRKFQLSRQGEPNQPEWGAGVYGNSAPAPLPPRSHPARVESALVSNELRPGDIYCGHMGVIDDAAMNSIPARVGVEFNGYASGPDRPPARMRVIAKSKSQPRFWIARPVGDWIVSR